MSTEPIPRMRTPTKIVAELKELDPGTEVTEYYIRQLVRNGAVPVVWAGSKALLNLDDVLALLRAGTIRANPEPETVEGIRRIDARSKAEGGGGVQTCDYHSETCSC